MFNCYFLEYLPPIAQGNERKYLLRSKFTNSQRDKRN